MIQYILDTNVVCEATAKEPDSGVVRWLDSHSEQCCLSCITIGEIGKGIFRLPEGKRKRFLAQWIDDLENDFSDRIYILDATVLKVWGKLYGKYEAKGFTMDVMDSMIAATALVHQLTVITRNTRDFPAEVKTLNPWLER